jgi:hypothetical protein
VPPRGPGRKPGASSYTLTHLSLWCLLIHTEASPSRGGGRKPGASSYTRKRVSPTGSRAKTWCLLYIHAEA